VLFAGQDMTFAEPAQRPVTSIFQDSNLFAHLTVAQNAGLGIAPRLRLSASERARVDGALAQVGLDGKQKRLPAALSGGERQRVALARALLRDRPVLLLDEPFASLGPALRSDMIDVVLALQAQKALTVIMVTHHAQDAAQFASRIAFIENGTLTRTLPATVLRADGTLNADSGHRLNGLAAYLGRR
jgi:thiamine transport system ATP-binding protein